MPEPFSGDMRDGKLYGYGVYDMKGSVAVCMAVMKILQEAGVSLRGDELLAAVADEEYASPGPTDVIERYPVVTVHSPP